MSTTRQLDAAIAAVASSSPYNGLTAQEFAAVTLKPLGTIGRALARLAAQGFIERVPGGEAGDHFRPNLLTSSILLRG